jgi:hypothetical protein
MNENTITLKFYTRSVNIPAFETVEEAQNTEPYVRYANWEMTYGYAVLFRLGELYAIYVHNADRYYQSYLPSHARVLYAGWWKKAILFNGSLKET